MLHLAHGFDSVVIWYPLGVLPDLQSGIKNVRPFRALWICNPSHLDDKKGFAILLAADCKS